MAKYSVGSIPHMDEAAAKLAATELRWICNWQAEEIDRLWAKIKQMHANRGEQMETCIYCKSELPAGRYVLCSHCQRKRATEVAAEDLSAAMERAKAESFSGEIRCLFLRAHKDRMILAAAVKMLQADAKELKRLRKELEYTQRVLAHAASVEAIRKAISAEELHGDDGDCEACDERRGDVPYAAGAKGGDAK